MSDNKVVLYEKKGPIAYITLNRPEKINAMNGEMYDLLEEAIKDYTVNDDLRCVIITGAGGNFSSGMDLKEDAEKAAGNHHTGYGLFPAYQALDLCLKPIIAAIDGYCVASGFNCAVLYCDMRIASERAKFAGEPQTEFGSRQGVRRPLGLRYPMPLTQNMSLGNAFYISWAGKMLSADEVLRMGIVSEVVPHENLMERATEIATRISQADPLQVRRHKEFLRRYMEVPGSFAQRLVDMIR
ncbi:enoyl-CoA hydratase/isomerase family protein [Thermodesulfobacteriota bacterium]